MRRWTIQLVGLIVGLVVIAMSTGAFAQRFELLPGQSVGKKSGESTVTTIVDKGPAHKMQFREQPPSGAAIQADGTYQVTSSMGGEIHAKFTVASLTRGGKTVAAVHALGLDLKPGAEFRFNVRLESGGTWMLTVFDPEIQPVLSRDMASK